MDRQTIMESINNRYKRLIAKMFPKHLHLREYLVFDNDY